MGIINGKVTEPISMSNISSAIGSGSNDLGTNCLSPRINKWSYYKPIAHSSVIRLSEDLIKDSDDGFTVRSFNNPVELFNAYAEGSAWVYGSPAEGPFRMSDFIGYYHNAKAWITPSFSKTDIAPLETVRCELVNEENAAYYNELGWEIDLFWVINNFNTFRYVNLNDVNIGYLLSENNGGARGVYWYNLGNFRDAVSEKGISFKALSEFPEGTYYIAPCLSTATTVPAGSATYLRDDEFTLAASFYALPCELSTIRISSSAGGVSIDNIQIIEGESKIAHQLGEFDAIVDTADFRFVNNNGEKVRVYYRVEAGGSIDNTILLEDSIATNSFGESDRIYINNKEWETGPNLSEIGIFVTVYYWLQGQPEKRHKFIIKAGGNKD